MESGTSGHMHKVEYCQEGKAVRCMVCGQEWSLYTTEPWKVTPQELQNYHQGQA